MIFTVTQDFWSSGIQQGMLHQVKGTRGIPRTKCSGTSQADNPLTMRGPHGGNQPLHSARQNIFILGVPASQRTYYGVTPLDGPGNVGAFVNITSLNTELRVIREGGVLVHKRHDRVLLVEQPLHDHSTYLTAGTKHRDLHTNKYSNGCIN